MKDSLKDSQPGRRGIMNTVWAVAYVLLTGLSMIYFSEWMFWSGRPVQPNIWQDVIATWLLYSFVTFLFLAAVDYFRVRSIWAIFLAGALYGWLVEGVIVPTMYADFPLNLSWTGLAWHALITTVFGWFWLPGALRRGGSAAFGAAAGFGLFAGVWSLGWRVEVDLASPATMTLYFAAFALMLAGALGLRDRLPRPLLGKPGLAMYSGLGLVVVYFGVITLPQVPFALLILPPLLGVILVALRRNRRNEGEAVLIQPVPPLTARQLLPLAATPLVAAVVYALGYAVPIAFPTLLLTYVLLTPAGFIVFGLSVYHIWRRSPQRA